MRNSEIYITLPWGISSLLPRLFSCRLVHHPSETCFLFSYLTTFVKHTIRYLITFAKFTFWGLPFMTSTGRGQAQVNACRRGKEGQLHVDVHTENQSSPVFSHAKKLAFSGLEF